MFQAGSLRLNVAEWTLHVKIGWLGRYSRRPAVVQSLCGRITTVRRFASKLRLQKTENKNAVYYFYRHFEAKERTFTTDVTTIIELSPIDKSIRRRTLAHPNRLLTPAHPPHLP
jgi:hypothetical protein